ncbi:hypothetical protein Pmani_007986, partial [Petrolisthes manimaculis]
TWKSLQDRGRGGGGGGGSSLEMLTLEFYFHVYFATLPLRHGHKEEVSRDVSSEGWHSTGLVTLIYALPYVPDPTLHPLPSHQSSRTRGVQELRGRLCSYLGVEEDTHHHDPLSLPTSITTDNHSSSVGAALVAQESAVSAVRSQRVTQEKRLQRLQDDYHKLIGVAWELTQGLEAAVRGEKVDLEGTLAACTHRYPELFTLTLTADTTAQPAAILLESMERCRQRPRGALNNPLPALHFSRVTADLGTVPETHVLLLLQALRQRITKVTTGGVRQAVVTAYVRGDVLGLRQSSSQCWSRLANTLTTAKPPHLAQTTARLLNALTAFTSGRTYLASDDVCQVLLAALRVDHPDPGTSDMALAALQKLSIRGEVQSSLIQRGAVEWLAHTLSTSMHPALSPYTLEYSCALLMNLTLRSEGRARCLPLGPALLSTLTSLLTTVPSHVVPYVTGILYSLLSHPSLRQDAVDIHLDTTLQHLAQGCGAEQRKQLEYVVEQVRRDPPLSPPPSPEPVMDLEEDPEWLEEELELDDPVRAPPHTPSGEHLLAWRYILHPGEAEEEGSNRREVVAPARSAPVVPWGPALDSSQPRPNSDGFIMRHQHQVKKQQQQQGMTQHPRGEPGGLTGGGGGGSSGGHWDYPSDTDPIRTNNNTTQYKSSVCESGVGGVGEGGGSWCGGDEVEEWAQSLRRTTPPLSQTRRKETQAHLYVSTPATESEEVSGQVRPNEVTGRPSITCPAEAYLAQHEQWSNTQTQASSNTGGGSYRVVRGEEEGREAGRYVVNGEGGGERYVPEPGGEATVQGEEEVEVLKVDQTTPDPQTISENPEPSPQPSSTEAEAQPVDDTTEEAVVVHLAPAAVSSVPCMASQHPVAPCQSSTLNTPPQEHTETTTAPQGYTTTPKEHTVTTTAPQGYTTTLQEHTMALQKHTEVTAAPHKTLEKTVSSPGGAHDESGEGKLKCDNIRDRPRLSTEVIYEEQPLRVPVLHIKLARGPHNTHVAVDKEQYNHEFGSARPDSLRNYNNNNNPGIATMPSKNIHNKHISRVANEPHNTTQTCMEKKPAASVTEPAETPKQTMEHVDIIITEPSNTEGEQKEREKSVPVIEPTDSKHKEVVKEGHDEASNNDETTHTQHHHQHQHHQEGTTAPQPPTVNNTFKEQNIKEPHELHNTTTTTTTTTTATTTTTTTTTNKVPNTATAAVVVVVNDQEPLPPPPPPKLSKPSKTVHMEQQDKDGTPKPLPQTTAAATHGKRKDDINTPHRHTDFDTPHIHTDEQHRRQSPGTKKDAPGTTTTITKDAHELPNSKIKVAHELPNSNSKSKVAHEIPNSKTKVAHEYPQAAIKKSHEYPQMTRGAHEYPQMAKGVPEYPSIKPPLLEAKLSVDSSVPLKRELTKVPPKPIKRTLSDSKVTVKKNSSQCGTVKSVSKELLSHLAPHNAPHHTTTTNTTPPHHHHQHHHHQHHHLASTVPPKEHTQPLSRNASRSQPPPPPVAAAALKEHPQVTPQVAPPHSSATPKEQQQHTGGGGGGGGRGEGLLLLRKSSLIPSSHPVKPDPVKGYDLVATRLLQQLVGESRDMPAPTSVPESDPLLRSLPAPKVSEYKVAFSSRPRIARTPPSSAAQGTRMGSVPGSAAGGPQSLNPGSPRHVLPPITRNNHTYTRAAT